MTVPYLEKPPGIIPIDLGRQLFVDDFLIETTTLERKFHLPEFHPANPVLTYDKPWELEGRAPFAAPFSDGIWYDAKDGFFKMWYVGGYLITTCYAVSGDGIHWEKPSLDVEPGTNVVFRQTRDSGTVWLDHAEPDPARRYKFFVTAKDEVWRFQLHCSPDGIHWSGPLAVSPPIGDRSTVFYNPFRKTWVWSIRCDCPPKVRARSYREHPDPVAGMTWDKEDVYVWTGADKLDPHHPKFPEVAPQLYNLDCAAYESLMIGYFSVHQGPENGECKRRQIQKRNEVLLGFSRDGFHWHRPDRRTFLGVTERDGDWNWGNMQSVGGGPVVVGDKLYFYVSGRSRTAEFWDARGSTGLGILRRDGFASMQVKASKPEGSLTTRPVVFTGKYLFVNLAAPASADPLVGSIS